MEKIIEILNSSKIDSKELRLACKHFVMTGSPFKKADYSVEKMNGFIGVIHNIYGIPESVIAIKNEGYWYVIATSRSNISRLEKTEHEMIGYWIGESWKVKSLSLFEVAEIWSAVKDSRFYDDIND